MFLCFYQFQLIPHQILHNSFKCIKVIKKYANVEVNYLTELVLAINSD